MTENLPNDSDGDALRSLISDGSDLAKPMSIDFAVAVPDANAGNSVAAAARPLGFQTDVYHNIETDSWTCYCTKTMIPGYEDIVAIQGQLDDLSRPFGGKSDGWGSFGNADREEC
jgi:hypothetical protein